jgi:hypothetical protein
VPIQFEELQQLWQSQPQPAAEAVDSHGVADELRRFGRRQNIIFSAKASLILWQIGYCFWRVGVSILSVSGEAIFLAGAISFLVTDWRNQLGIARLDFTKPWAGFVDSALERLRDPNAPFRRWFWLNMLLVGVGANLLLGCRWAASTPQQRWVSHATATATPFACWVVGLTLRTKRYELEYRPLMERLTAMKKALAEQSQ